MNFVGKAFDEIAEGDTFGQTLTIDSSHISRACGLFGDFNPLHSNDEFCASSRFGQRILHGPMTGALMSASIGMYFYGTATAYLEHNCQFLAPVFAGDTLTTTWTIKETLAKPRHNGGIAVLQGVCQNQRGETIAEAQGKILLINRQAGGQS
ncbi:3-hydroxybutyryl-CoA dehydratase [Pseudomonas duriflava]|uniref:3-hydroxybutyryl-CoA dehydratase n=1 Tax=Pseudomonas duriflava TaxID=459528 RepID=A0A562Q7D4_9PSED|nr:MaoC family dehydratase [Pseudomonas duriflava]TWI52672.1 3-hydroxybutyryl-CoA dehydratase [Pseudomonas duriflava]